MTRYNQFVRLRCNCCLGLVMISCMIFIENSFAQNYSQTTFSKEVLLKSTHMEMNQSNRGYSQMLAAASPSKDISISQNMWKGENMEDLSKRSFITGALFLPTMITGYQLARGGHPPNSLLLTVHKLTGLANFVLLNKTVYDQHKMTGLTGKQMVATIVMNACFVSTIATGAMVSIDDSMPNYVQTAHRVGPWLTIVSSGMLLYFLGH